MISSIPSLNPTSFCIVGLACCVLYYCSSLARTSYRLRHIPTPSILATFSYFWLARTTYSGKQYWVHRDLHKKYGPLVRIGPNEILTDDPEIIKKISSTHSLYKRGSWYLTGRFNPYHDNLFTILEPDAHKKAKARSLAAYSGRETPGVEYGINDQVKTMIDVLRERYVATSPEKDQPLLDLGPFSCYFTMDVITHLAFGEEVGYLKDETDHFEFLRGVRELWPQMSTSADVPWIRRILFSPLFLKMLGPKPTDKKGFGALMGVAEQYVNRRFAPDAEQQKDMLGSFISRGFSREECQAEGLFMLLAGTESTACAIRSTLVYTITSPFVYFSLKKEVSLAIREGRVSYPIALEEARKLPYLQAVIYEGIRMRPPLLGLFPKVVPQPGDCFHGKQIPPGTSICMNTSSLLRSASLFGADADVFRPERFTELDKARRSEMERNVELAFGYGQWMCAGKSIAFMELNKVMFELFRAFDIQIISPLKPCDVQSYGIFLESDLRVKISNDPNHFDLLAVA